MTYRIKGLDPERFRPLFAIDDAGLAAQSARRVIADGPGFPCRVSLEEAAAGEEVILLNFVSHDVPGPFRTAYPIYVRAAADEAAEWIDEMPPLLAVRPLSLRGFDGEGMLRGAKLAAPGEAVPAIRDLFARDDVASIHAHSPAYGCYLATIERN